MDAIEILHDEFSRRQQVNHRYSLRSFARTLDVSAGLLCDIMARRRNLTVNLATRFSENLRLEVQRRESFVASCVKTQRPRRAGASAYDKVDMDSFALIADWYHYAILSLSELPDARHDYEWIAGQLRISTTEARIAVERLIRLGFLKSEEGKLKEAADNITTTRNLPSTAIRRHHQQMIAKASSALETQDVEERDVTSTTMSISRKNIPRAKEMIRKFRRELSALLEDGDRDDVYALNVQLFSLLK